MYNLSYRVISGTQTQAERESYVPDTTRRRVLQVAGETLQFYRSTGKVILKYILGNFYILFISRVILEIF